MRLLDKVISEGVQTIVCGIKYIDLTAEAIKTLGVHFSYEKLQLQKKV